MIKFCDDYETERDAYQWVLYIWKNGKNKDGEPTRTCARRYYPNLRQVCEAVIDFSAGQCNGVEEWTAKMDALMASLEEKFK